MRKDYQRRVKRLSNSFIKDVVDTLKRIDTKDGKAYPLRIQKSVAKRWAHVPRYKITLTLQWLEYRGLVVCTLESPEEYKERMKKYPGLNKKGLRRKYYKMNPKRPSESMGSVTEYEKLSYDDLGIDYEKLEEYPL